jgi:hypothetical protein
MFHPGDPTRKITIAIHQPGSQGWPITLLNALGLTVAEFLALL